MRNITIVLILISLAALTSCSSLKGNRNIASNTDIKEISQTDIEKVSHIVTTVLEGYVTKPFDIKVVNSDEAVEYIVLYNPADHGNVFGFAGMRVRNMRILVNEVSISLQTKANAGNKEFDLKTRKYHFIRFSKFEEY
ncbi:MAG: putative RNA-binding protein YlqC (UPF0109 family) [Thermoproteota archaeon]|jgi:predicted RNA-binding protein YlqC (UPF0109 family)